MPLVRGPTAIRRPRRSENDRIGESARTTKNRGPAFIGAAMARSIGRGKGASPFFARPIQFEAMKPSPIAGVEAQRVLHARGGRRQYRDRGQCGPSFEQDLQRAALAVE